MFENVLRNTMRDLKKAFKEEIVDKIDDYAPIVMGVASFALMIVARTPATKKVIPPVVNIFVTK